MDSPGLPAFERAARWIESADALLMAAGAGMGVDSGLPDFRGDHGFWQAYPAYAQLGLSFVDLANPSWFATDPSLAWGFYGHRQNLYRATRPHDGFGILRDLAARRPRGGFVFTSNVDGQFQVAGFEADRIYEVHGSLDWLQCTRSCGLGLFETPDRPVDVDPDTFRASGPLPTCPSCGALARPNVLMFGDWGWDSSRSDRQQRRLMDWLRNLEGGRLVIIECGAGLGVPTVRAFSERLVQSLGARLVRINTREPQVPAGQIALPLGALEGLRVLADRAG